MMTDKKIKVKFAAAHNVFRNVDESEAGFVRNQPTNMRVAPQMQLLIDKLLARNPQWEFLASGYPSSDNDVVVYSRFTIECDGEELGWVGCERHWRTGENKYEFDCGRLKLKRQKSTTPHTKDLNKAVKTIVGSMYNRTPAERIQTAKQATASLVGRTANQAVYEYGRAQGSLADQMVRFVEARWDEFCAVPMDGVEAKAREVLLDKGQTKKDVDTIDGPRNLSEGYLLIEAGSSFIVARYNLAEPPVIKRLDELPDRLKGSLGMLKLLEPKKYATGIGMRIDETTFYVIDADE